MPSPSFSPLPMEEMAGEILKPLDLTDEEIDKIIEEWCSYDFEIGQVTRSLTKLQRIAFEYIMKREGYWGEYKAQFSCRASQDGIALQEETWQSKKWDKLLEPTISDKETRLAYD